MLGSVVVRFRKRPAATEETQRNLATEETQRKPGHRGNTGETQPNTEYERRCLPDLTVAVFPLRSSVFLCFSKLTQYREVLAFEPRERFPCKLLPLRGVRDGKGQEADQCERTTWSGWTNGSGRSQGTPRKPHERDRATQRTDGSSRQGIASAVVAHRSDSSAIGSSRTRTGDPS